MPSGVSLQFRDAEPRPDTAVRYDCAGFSIESVRIRERRTLDYDWQGERHFLAAHDIMLSDGEVAVDGHGGARRLDLRDTLTFVPRHARVSGWSEFAGEDHGYTALFFDPDLAEAEHERPLLGSATRPLVYFDDASLCRTLRRLEALLAADFAPDPMVVETLGLYAVLQLQPLLDADPRHAAGRLSLSQQRRVCEFVDAQLGTPISLSDLSGVTGLSRYHFARSFTRTYGQPPHRYVLSRRITLAAALLADSRLPVGEIALRVGFSSPARLSTAFRRIFGTTPRDFRQSFR